VYLSLVACRLLCPNSQTDHVVLEVRLKQMGESACDINFAGNSRDILKKSSGPMWLKPFWNVMGSFGYNETKRRQLNPMSITHLRPSYQRFVMACFSAMLSRNIVFSMSYAMLYDITMTPNQKLILWKKYAFRNTIVCHLYCQIFITVPGAYLE
jgi:hypothetical protein